jgi:uncharacterized protein YecE (DUF72 family)
MAEPGRIFIGIGGWTYAPWRANFYPDALPQKRELNYASRKLSAIEINGTYYRTQSAVSFAKWHDDTPDGFMFSLKALRHATQRSVLADAASSVERFTRSGLEELRSKLGPIVWQFPPTRRFQPEDFERFLKLLPLEVRGLPLRHALDVRHDSFKTPEFLALARNHGMTTVFADSDDYPSFADVTGDFVYARLMRSKASIAKGYPLKELRQWAERARIWAAGGEPDDLPRVEKAVTTALAKPRPVFLYFIGGAKERNPEAAMALRAMIEDGHTPPSRR